MQAQRAAVEAYNKTGSISDAVGAYIQDFRDSGQLYGGDRKAQNAVESLISRLKSEAAAKPPAKIAQPPKGEPPKAPKVEKGFGDAFDESPLVNVVLRAGGVLSKSAARAKRGAAWFKENKSLWDNAPRFKDPRHNKIYNARTGVDPDKAAQAASDPEVSLLPEGADADTLWNALAKESDAAISINKQRRAAAADASAAIGKAGEQEHAFKAAIARPEAGEFPVHASELAVGDVVNVNGVDLKVKSVGDTITLEDGKEYGIQHVDNDIVFYGRLLEEKPIVLQSAEYGPDLRVKINREGGQWQATLTDSTGVVGKQVFDTHEQALGEFQGGHEHAFGTDFVEAPPDLAMKPTAEEINAEQSRVAEVPTLRSGENQGDLLSKQTENLTLVGEKGTDFGARQIAAEKAAKAAEAARVKQESDQGAFGFGPGAAAATEPLSVGTQIKQLTETISSDLRTSKGSVAARVQRAIQRAGAKVVTARESLHRGVDTMRATWLALKNGYLKPPVFGEFLDRIKDWQAADQRTSFEARAFVNKLRSEVKDPLTREAFTNYIQADGDLALLAERAAKSNIKYRPGYEAAMNLTDAQKAFAANVRQYFDSMLQDGIDAGLLDHGIENYITQIWKQPNRITRELQADLQSGKLQIDFQFARKRIFESFFEGEKAGFAPGSKDVAALVAAYDSSFNRSLSARGLVKGLQEAKSPAGEPIVSFSGTTQALPIDEKPPNAYLIRADKVPEGAVTKDGRKYQLVDHPALRGWKVAVQEPDRPAVYYRSDMLVHPDYAPQLRNILGSSALRQGKLAQFTTRPMLIAGAFAKQTKLSLSIFHLDQEGLHGLFHRVNPANLERINFDDPKQWALVRGGLQVADYHAMELFSEGLRGGGLVSKIPVLGRLQNGFNDFLFKDYIPRLKMTMALHAFERNVKRYGDKLSTDQIAELTANQGNAAFGELNYKMMARNPTVQDFLRLTILAPDFLEARSRFVGQALKPYGAEQRAALFLMGATLYVGARALNQWLDNDPHWGKPFSVIYNGREYRLRTVLGDAIELGTDPRRFFYNRMSPWLKQGVTLGTGRDYRGIKLTAGEQVIDALSWFVPIPAGSGNDPTSFGQRFAGSAGISNKPAPTADYEAKQSAFAFRDRLARTDPKLRAEITRARKETYAEPDYARLNRALIANDRGRIVDEITALVNDKGKTKAQLTEYYANLPAQPFTNSRAIEAQWVAQMSAGERAQRDKAIAERQMLASRFIQLLPYAR